MQQSHTTTTEWQSFELRMRRRRVQRCVLRATVALEAGLLDEARTALDEAAGLEPEYEGAKEVRVRIAAAEAQRAAPAALPAGDLPLGVLVPSSTDPAADLSVSWNPSVKPSSNHVDFGKRSRRSLVVAAALMLAATGAGWFVIRPEPFASTEVGTNRSTEQGRAGQVAATAAAGASEPPLTTPSVTAAAASDVVTVRTEVETVVPVAGEATAPPTEPPDVQGAAIRPEAPDASNLRTAASRRAGTAAENGTAVAPPPAVSAEPDPALNRAPARAIYVPPPPAPALPESLLPSDPSPPLPAPSEAAALRTPAAGFPAVATDSSTPAAPAPVATTGAGESSVRAALARYETAYSRLDAAAAGAVWPSVDRRALSRAFEGLASQTISLGRCDIRLRGASAQADCTGSAQWTPKVGGGAQYKARRWRFELKQSGADWQIVSADTR